MKLQDGSIAACRVIHEDNLHIYLRRGAMHAAKHAPKDGLRWRPTHNTQVQGRRATTKVTAGPRGTMLDYLPFHFGPRNIFLFNLHTGRVPGYTERQDPLMTLVISVDDVIDAGYRFVFYSGHALMALSQPALDDRAELANLDWGAIDGNTWPRSQPERHRCKQAEFMVYRSLPWDFVREIRVCDPKAKQRVEAILATEAPPHSPPVNVAPTWYF